MARMPQARWQGEHSPRREMESYDIVCVHTIVGYAPAHAAHFSTHGSGTIDQSRDTRYQSGANLEGNPRVIAIENEDHGSAFPNWNTTDGHAVPALTDEQVEANAQILAWAHKEHGVPLQLCPDSRPGSRGLAYHRQGIDGNFDSYEYGGRVSGGENWSTSRGKVCPGDRRIDQIPAILERAQQIVTGDTTMEPSDFLTSFVRTDGDETAENTWSKTRRDAFRSMRALFYNGDSNQSNQYAVEAGVRVIDNPMHPGSEENPEADKPQDEQRRASWRFAIERIWKNCWWTLVRVRRIETKLDAFISTQDQRIQQAVADALAEHDKRLVNVDISVEDQTDDQNDDTA